MYELIINLFNKVRYFFNKKIINIHPKNIFSEIEGDEYLILKDSLKIFEKNIDDFLHDKNESINYYLDILTKIFHTTNIVVKKIQVHFIQYKIINTKYPSKSVYWYSFFINTINISIKKYISEELEKHELILKKFNCSKVSVLVHIDFETEEDWKTENYLLYTKNIEVSEMSNEKISIIIKSYKKYLEKEEYYQIKRVNSIRMSFV